MGYAQARHLDSDAIPVVDISTLRDNSNPQPVADALHAASQGLGFIYIKGHGIPATAIDAARSAGLEFFRTGSEQKNQIQVSNAHRGWLPPGHAKMDDDALPDLKESFIWGTADLNGQRSHDHPLRGANQWPAQLPQLQTHAMVYLQHAHDVAHALMRGFALGLQRSEDFFLRSADKPLSRASFVYYPAQPASLGTNQFGVGPHTDFGVLTVLCQDDCGGLQVQDVNGNWLHARPFEDTLVVNVGDLLARWTNGAYKSTPHRVVNTSGRERLSIVLAFDPNPETRIDPTELFPNQAANQAPISCGDYLTWRFGKAFSYRHDGASSSRNDKI